MSRKKKLCGKLNFTGTLDVTDPCYRKDVWCRINNVSIKPGEYQCIAWLFDRGDWRNRVAEMGIFLNGIIPVRTKWERYPGRIGVDAGLAGIFENKPDFTSDQWNEVCSLCDKAGYPLVIVQDGPLFKGFFTSSGHGDGEYALLVCKNETGEIVAMKIVFM